MKELEERGIPLSDLLADPVSTLAKLKAYFPVK